MDLICSILSAVRDYCKVPISAKIRIRLNFSDFFIIQQLQFREDREQTKEYARRLVNAGATMLTVHGRTRDMRVRILIELVPLVNSGS